jgi:histidine decarboxylase
MLMTRQKSSVAVASSAAAEEEDEEDVMTLPPPKEATTTTTTAEKKNDLTLTTFDRTKSGSPSPWAVFDSWGGAEEEYNVCSNGVQPLDPVLEAKLSPSAVRIPLEQPPQPPQPGETESNSSSGSGDDSTGSSSSSQESLPLPSETEILHAYQQLLQKKSSVHFGYPYNLMFDYRELAPFMNYSINNLGDPFVPSNYGVHSRQFELAVIDFFAELWKMPRDSYWGYVTTSGTEGNLHGILLAREKFPNGILYTSQETHYSVFKAARYYRMPCRSIPTLPMGEVDYDALSHAISQNLDKPVILNVNIGTTVKGAVDNLDRILRILETLQIPREQYYIHCDGALFALMMPFIRHAPEVSFQKPIDSMAVSGHKFLGCPMPCGVTLSRKEHVQNLEQHIDYLNSVDTTIMGSRNGQAALYIWYSLRKKGLAGMQRDVKHCMDNARYLRDALHTNGFTARLNDLSTTVVLERPLDDALVKRWQLACEEDIAHVVVMPNVSKNKIDRFVQELVSCRNEFGHMQPLRHDSPLTKLAAVW